MAAAAAGPASSQRLFQSFSDALIDGDPQAALEELTKALEQNPDDAQYYCQRAYCHILLGKYRDGIADVKKSLELNPNNCTALLRKGICEYHEKDYASALETFAEGQKLDSTDTNFDTWIKRCQEIQNGSESEVSASQRTQSKIKYDWYQTESHVIITLMIKSVQKNDVRVGFSERELSALVKIPAGEDYSLKLRLLHPIIPEQSTFKVLSTKEETTSHIRLESAVIRPERKKCTEAEVPHKMTGGLFKRHGAKGTFPSGNVSGTGPLTRVLFMYNSQQLKIN